MAVSVAHVTTVDVSLRYLLLNQIESLRQAGYHVTGVSSPGPDVSALEAAGIAHYSVPMARTIAPAQDLRSLWNLYRLFRRERFTIVHTHNPKPGLLGQVAARLARVPIVVNTLHGLYFHEQTPRLLYQLFADVEKIAAGCSDVILSQSKEDVETAMRLGICSKSKIRYLGNGINIQRFRPGRFSQRERRERRRSLGIPADVPLVGFVGRLAARRKGFLDFLRAGQLLAHRFPEVRFLIVGTAGPGEPDSVQPVVAQEFGVADRCLFLGHRPNHELPGYYSIMNVLILPSLFEGVPRAVMEGAAMGLPAVVTDVKGNREAVDHRRNGLLVPFGDAQALADAIAELLADPHMAQRMGRVGRQMAEERFDEQKVFARVKDEYARLLREKGLPLPGVEQCTATS